MNKKIKERHNIEIPKISINITERRLNMLQAEKIKNLGRVWLIICQASKQASKQFRK
ncbi:hypothetical protein KJ830_00610 [bacterium]|nr:hypothetical protein [bacterium]MBU4509527.1 hypothetical protein [bacterium]